MIGKFWTVLIVCDVMVLAGAAFAYCNGFLTPWQMCRGGRKGLPFIAHGGMWSDFFLISPLIAYIVAHYSSEWPWPKLVVAGFMCTVITDLLHQSYKRSPFPEAHVRDGQLTPAGRVHYGYMVIALTTLSMFYFHKMTFEGDDLMLLVAAIILCVHMMVANHMVLGSFAPKWYPGLPFESTGAWVAISGTAIFTFGRHVWLVLVGF